jgi:tetratricopeptide (TPR) repeat protein
MKKILLPTALLAGMLFINSSFATPIQDAQKLYAKGDFKAAVDIASEIDTAEGQAFAAKANSIYAGTQTENKQEPMYAISEKYANNAVKLNNKYAPGYFELARALGRLSQLRGTLVALSQGLGTKIKTNLETCIDLDRSSASCMVAYGLWHAEIVAKGVGWIYGANEGASINFFERAIAIEPKIIIHRVEYAKGMLLLNRDKYKAAAKSQLELALKLEPRDAADKLDLERAKRDLAELNK